MAAATRRPVACAGSERRRDRQAPAGVVHVGRLEVALQRRPPAADGVRPERPAAQRPGEPTGDAQRAAEDPSTAAGCDRLERRGHRRPRSAGTVAPDRDRAVALEVRNVRRQDCGDLDGVAGPVERTGDPQPTRVGLRGVADENDRPPAIRGRCRRRRRPRRLHGSHHARPVSRPYASKRVAAWASQL